MSPITRYRLAVGFLIYGPLAMFACVPTSFIMFEHGGFWRAVLLFLFVSGWLAIVAATVLGIYNVYYFKQNPPPPPQARIFK